MQLTTILTFASAGVAAAAPASTAALPTQNVILRTAHATNPRHNGLYLDSYHTGAGAADAVFTTNKTVARVGSLNATDTSFEFEDAYGHLNLALSANGTCLISYPLIDAAATAS